MKLLNLLIAFFIVFKKKERSIYGEVKFSTIDSIDSNVRMRKAKGNGKYPKGCILPISIA